MLANVGSLITRTIRVWERFNKEPHNITANYLGPYAREVIGGKQLVELLVCILLDVLKVLQSSFTLTARNPKKGRLFGVQVWLI